MMRRWVEGIVGLGVDHVETADMAASLATFGDRFATRVFTPAELSTVARLAPAERVRHLAGRFAAKEAVAKAIDHPGHRALPWTEIEVRNTPSGRPEVHLYGGAFAWCAATDVAQIDVSISHDTHCAIAVAMTIARPAPLRDHHPAQHHFEEQQ